MILEINNNRKMFIVQSENKIQVKTVEIATDKVESQITIPEGDMVMLINYYKYIKDNDVQCDFVNPDGKNTK